MEDAPPSGALAAGETAAKEARPKAKKSGVTITVDGAKSLDRNDFTLDPLGKAELADGARTLAAVTAHAIARAADHVPERSRTWVLCGGGRKNGLIGRELETLVEPAHVLIAEDLGWNGDSMEAEAWAYLAVRALNGLPLTWPTTTGCREPVTGGVLARPGG